MSSSADFFAELGLNSGSSNINKSKNASNTNSANQAPKQNDILDLDADDSDDDRAATGGQPNQTNGKLANQSGSKTNEPRQPQQQSSSAISSADLFSMLSSSSAQNQPHWAWWTQWGYIDQQNQSQWGQKQQYQQTTTNRNIGNNFMDFSQSQSTQPPSLSLNSAPKISMPAISSADAFASFQQQPKIVQHIVRSLLVKKWGIGFETEQKAQQRWNLSPSKQGSGWQQWGKQQQTLTNVNANSPRIQQENINLQVSINCSLNNIAQKHFCLVIEEIMYFLEDKGCSGGGSWTGKISDYHQSEVLKLLWQIFMNANQNFFLKQVSQWKNQQNQSGHYQKKGNWSNTDQILWKNKPDNSIMDLDWADTSANGSQAQIQSQSQGQGQTNTNPFIFDWSVLDDSEKILDAGLAASITQFVIRELTMLSVSHDERQDNEGVSGEEWSKSWNKTNKTAGDLIESSPQSEPDLLVNNLNQSSSKANQSLHQQQKQHQEDFSADKEESMGGVLVELAPLYPEIVIGGLLKMMDQCTVSTENANAQDQNAILLSILGDIAHSSPFVLSNRFHDVLARVLPMLTTARTTELRICLCQVLSSLCIASTVCLYRDQQPSNSGQPRDERNEDFSDVILKSFGKQSPSAWFSKQKSLKNKKQTLWNTNLEQDLTTNTSTSSTNNLTQNWKRGRSRSEQIYYQYQQQQNENDNKIKNFYTDFYTIINQDDPDFAQRFSKLGIAVLNGEKRNQEQVETAFAQAHSILLNTWAKASMKDAKLLAHILDSLGHLCFMVPKDYFVASLEAMLSFYLLLSRPKITATKTPKKMRIPSVGYLRGLALFLIAGMSIKDGIDPKKGQKTEYGKEAKQLIETAHVAFMQAFCGFAVVLGPLRYLFWQNQDVINRHTQSLACVEILSEEFMESSIFGFVLERLDHLLISKTGVDGWNKGGGGGGGLFNFLPASRAQMGLESRASIERNMNQNLGEAFGFTYQEERLSMVLVFKHLLYSPNLWHKFSRGMKFDVIRTLRRIIEENRDILHLQEQSSSVPEINKSAETGLQVYIAETILVVATSDFFETVLYDPEQQEEKRWSQAFKWQSPKQQTQWQTKQDNQNQNQQNQNENKDDNQLQQQQMQTSSAAFEDITFLLRWLIEQTAIWDEDIVDHEIEVELERVKEYERQQSQNPNQQQQVAANTQWNQKKKSRYNDWEAPTVRDVKDRCGLVLAQITQACDGTHFWVLEVLWPMLIKQCVNVKYVPALPTIAKAIKQLIYSIKSWENHNLKGASRTRSGNKPHFSLRNLWAIFSNQQSTLDTDLQQLVPAKQQDGSQNQNPQQIQSQQQGTSQVDLSQVQRNQTWINQPQQGTRPIPPWKTADVLDPVAAFSWLYLCLHDPHLAPGLGTEVLDLLKALSPFLHPVMGKVWNSSSSRGNTNVNMSGNTNPNYNKAGNDTSSLEYDRLGIMKAFLISHDKRWNWMHHHGSTNVNEKKSNFQDHFQEKWFSALAHELYFCFDSLNYSDPFPAQLLECVLRMRLKLMAYENKALTNFRNQSVEKFGNAAGNASLTPSKVSFCSLQMKAGFMNVFGVWLSKSYSATPEKLAAVMELMCEPQYLDESILRRAWAKAIGYIARSHFELTLQRLWQIFVNLQNTQKEAEIKSVAEVKNEQDWQFTQQQQQGFLRGLLKFNNNEEAAQQLQQAYELENLKATLHLSRGYCAIFSPSRNQLLENVRDHMVDPLLVALQDDKRSPVIMAAAIESIKLTCDAINYCESLELHPIRDPFVHVCTFWMQGRFAKQQLMEILDQWNWNNNDSSSSPTTNYTSKHAVSSFPNKYDEQYDGVTYGNEPEAEPVALSVSVVDSKDKDNSDAKDKEKAADLLELDNYQEKAQQNHNQQEDDNSSKNLFDADQIENALIERGNAMQTKPGQAFQGATDAKLRSLMGHQRNLILYELVELIGEVDFSQPDSSGDEDANVNPNSELDHKGTTPQQSPSANQVTQQGNQAQTQNQLQLSASDKLLQKYPDPLICLTLDSMSQLISLPLDLPSDLHAQMVEGSLNLLITSLQWKIDSQMQMDNMKQGVDSNQSKWGPQNQNESQDTSGVMIDSCIWNRILSTTDLIKALLFHSHSWLGVSKLLQSIHNAGCQSSSDFIRWTCTHLLRVVCLHAPIVEATNSKQSQLQWQQQQASNQQSQDQLQQQSGATEDVQQNSIGEWCECLALLVPRLGDSCFAISVVAVDAIQLLLTRCEWTISVQICQPQTQAQQVQEETNQQSKGQYATKITRTSYMSQSRILSSKTGSQPDLDASLLGITQAVEDVFVGIQRSSSAHTKQVQAPQQNNVATNYLSQSQQHASINAIIKLGTASQQLAVALVKHLPPQIIPPIIQHVMPGIYDADTKAAASTVDTLGLILQQMGNRLTQRRAANLICSLFDEVEEVGQITVRERVLACIKGMACSGHFDFVIQELLERGPKFSPSQISLINLLGKDKQVLLKLIHHLTDRLNNVAMEQQLQQFNENQLQPQPYLRVAASATVMLGHLFTIDDSSVRLILSKSFSQLFCTFLLRIGTSVYSLSCEKIRMLVQVLVLNTPKQEMQLNNKASGGAQWFLNQNYAKIVKDIEDQLLDWGGGGGARWNQSSQADQMLWLQQESLSDAIWSLTNLLYASANDSMALALEERQKTIRERKQMFRKKRSKSKNKMTSRSGSTLQGSQQQTQAASERWGQGRNWNPQLQLTSVGWNSVKCSGRVPSSFFQEEDIISALIALFCRHHPNQHVGIAQFVTPFLSTGSAGQRLAAIVILGQLVETVTSSVHKLIDKVNNEKGVEAMLLNWGEHYQTKFNLSAQQLRNQWNYNTSPISTPAWRQAQQGADDQDVHNSASRSKSQDQIQIDALVKFVSQACAPHLIVHADQSSEANPLVRKHAIQGLSSVFIFWSTDAEWMINSSTLEVELKQPASTLLRNSQPSPRSVNSQGTEIQSVWKQIASGNQTPQQTESSWRTSLSVPPKIKRKFSQAIPWILIEWLMLDELSNEQDKHKGIVINMSSEALAAINLGIDALVQHYGSVDELLVSTSNKWWGQQQQQQQVIVQNQKRKLDVWRTQYLRMFPKLQWVINAQEPDLRMGGLDLLGRLSSILEAYQIQSDSVEWTQLQLQNYNEEMQIKQRYVDEVLKLCLVCCIRMEDQDLEVQQAAIGCFERICGLMQLDSKTRRRLVEYFDTAGFEAFIFPFFVDFLAQYVEYQVPLESIEFDEAEEDEQIENDAQVACEESSDGKRDTAPETEQAEEQDVAKKKNHIDDLFAPSNRSKTMEDFDDLFGAKKESAVEKAETNNTKQQVIQQKQQTQSTRQNSLQKPKNLKKEEEKIDLFEFQLMQCQEYLNIDLQQLEANQKSQQYQGHSASIIAAAGMCVAAIVNSNKIEEGRLFAFNSRSLIGRSRLDMKMNSNTNTGGGVTSQSDQVDSPGKQQNKKKYLGTGLVADIISDLLHLMETSPDPELKIKLSQVLGHFASLASSR